MATLMWRWQRFLSLNAKNAQQTGSVKPTGDVGVVLQAADSRQLQITWDYTIAGTAPAAITLVLEGNNIGPTAADSTWFIMDTGNTVGGEPGRSEVNREAKCLRVRVSAITGGDGTTLVTAGIVTN